MLVGVAVWQIDGDVFVDFVLSQQSYICRLFCCCLLLRGCFDRRIFVFPGSESVLNGRVILIGSISDSKRVFRVNRNVSCYSPALVLVYILASLSCERYESPIVAESTLDIHRACHSS